MLRRFRLSVLAYAIGLIALISLATAWNIHGNYRAHREVNDRLMSTLATAAASQAEVSVRAIDLFLADASEAIVLERWPDKAVAAHLQARLAGFPEVRDLIVVGADGKTVGPILSANAATPASLDLHDREYFLHQRDRWMDNALAISRAVVSRALGETVIPMSRPLKSRDGKFAGLVAVSLSASHLDHLLAPIAASPSASGALLRKDGTFLARYPDGDGFRGRDASSAHPFLEELARSPIGVIEVPDTASMDGHSRLVAFHALSSYPLVAAATDSTLEAYKEWRKSALQGITTVLALSAAVLLLALMVERRSMALRHAAAIIQSSDDAIIGKTLDGIVTSWNKGAERLFGYGAKEIVGQPMRRLFPDGQGDEETAILDRIGSGQSIGPQEAVRQHRDGSLIDISVRISPIRDSRGKIIGASTIAHDIAARKRAEQALRHSEARLSSIFRISPVAIAITAKEDGRVLDVNDTFLSMFGFDDADVAGHTSVELGIWITPADREAMLASLNKDGRVQNLNLKLRRKSGEIGEFLYSAAPIRLDERDCVLSVALDVTEYRQAKQRVAELRQSNTELEQFAYVASHDLREPLRMVTSYLGLLKQQLGSSLDKDIAEFIHYAVDGAKRMDALIHDLLEYSRVGHEAVHEPMALAEAVAEATGNLELAIADVAGTVHIADGWPNVAGDRHELMRLFQNLIGNALKYRHPQRAPEISVGWRDGGDEGWVVFIKDNGSGIEERNFERVFGIFQRLVSRNACEGTGIGLAICRKIVEQHGGRIWLESVVGEGTTFLFTLPKLETAP